MFGGGARLGEASRPELDATLLFATLQVLWFDAQYLSAVQEKQMGPDKVKTMAHGVPDCPGLRGVSQAPTTFPGYQMSDFVEFPT